MNKYIKTGILALGVSIFVTQMNAQLQQGTILVGTELGNMGFGLGSRGNFTINLAPKVGYFVKNNIAVGAMAKLNFVAVSGLNNTYNYSVLGFGRYYIPKEEIYNPLNDGRFFGELRAGLGGLNGTGIGFNLGAGVGYAYYLTSNIALEASVGLHSTFGTGNNTGMNFNLGFMMHFPTVKLKEEAKKIQNDMKEIKFKEEK